MIPSGIISYLHLPCQREMIPLGNMSRRSALDGKTKAAENRGPVRFIHLKRSYFLTSLRTALWLQNVRSV